MSQLSAQPTPLRYAVSPKVQRLLKDLNSNWKMRLYFMHKLPSCWFWGVRVRSVTPEAATVALPFNWRSQNPFRSTYFAAQCGAGELSTGLLALLAIKEQGARISMLITRVEAEFVKKADGMATFSCPEGPAIRAAVRRAAESGEGEQVRVCSEGRLANGELASKIYLTWSFKLRKS